MSINWIFLKKPLKTWIQSWAGRKWTCSKLASCWQGWHSTLADFQDWGQWLQDWVRGAEEPEARSTIICSQAEVLALGLGGGNGKATVTSPPNQANSQHGFGIFPGSYALHSFLQPSRWFWSYWISFNKPFSCLTSPHWRMDSIVC